MIERLRRWLLAPVARLRAWAERVLGEDGTAPLAAAPAAPGGPPAHWLEHIRRRRPELVAGLTRTAPLFEAQRLGPPPAAVRPPAAAAVAEEAASAGDAEGPARPLRPPAPAPPGSAETRRGLRQPAFARRRTSAAGERPADAEPAAVAARSPAAAPPREARPPRPGPEVSGWGRLPFRRRPPRPAAAAPAAPTPLPGPELEPPAAAAFRRGAAGTESPPRRPRGSLPGGRPLVEPAVAAASAATVSVAATSPAETPSAFPAVGRRGDGPTASFAAAPRRAAMVDGRWPRPPDREAEPLPRPSAERLEPPPRSAAPLRWPAPAADPWPDLPASRPASAVEPAAVAGAGRARRLRREQEGKAWNE